MTLINGEQIRKLEEQNAALAAQLEALQSRVSVAERVEAIFNEAQELSFDDCVKLFPDEIRQVRADAGREGYLACAEEYGLANTYATTVGVTRSANKYHASILAGKE